jgi:hypothetical protein
MEEVIRSHMNSNEFMGSILVARNGQILLDKGYGYAQFRVASPRLTRHKIPDRVDRQTVHCKAVTTSAALKSN